MNVTPQEETCFIFDGHEAIKRAFRAISRRMNAPHTHHVYCIRHFFANFMRHLKNKEMHQNIVNAGKLLNLHFASFNHILLLIFYVALLFV